MTQSCGRPKRFERSIIMEQFRYELLVDPHTKRLGSHDLDRLFINFI
jgi:hypothetical protein